MSRQEVSRQEVSRYHQIAAELRRLIEVGELSPGDRVPSTREITRRWHVAMATATKALTELRRAGLVHAVPGIGTVVNGRNRSAHIGTPARRAASDAAITLGRIVARAVAVADNEGLAAVSMRRVATELGVATMSLYRHVADKDDLLGRMMQAVFDEWRFPTDSPPTWRERLTTAAKMLWATFRRHPWLASAMSVTRPQLVASALSYTEWVLATLDDHGLDLSTMLTVHVTLFNYVRGTAIHIELEAEAEALSGVDNEVWMRAQRPALRAVAGGGRYPVFERVLAADYDFDLDALFEFGLRRMLDGLSPLMGDAPGKTAAS
ncbi:MAG: TetR/AcrR family transcriptional regulator C-terminal domain-containing protein [Kutzneria sp.]|nr:TetR/AcrR family transcriptional regulator C-terminal domain-containing protein [Kutzneria sp.]MBV9847234.1 TetR/AcrR family transcriptional regulator C-terminal domain-containing protein [Kutzneria sp.]